MISTYSPKAPHDLIAEVPSSTADDVRRAYRAASNAQREWRSCAAADRCTVLDAAAQRIAAAAPGLTDLIVREVGKPLGEARGEVARSVAILRYYAQQVFDPIGAVHEPSGRGLLYTHRRPLGVAGLITPWNFPLAIPLWKAAPALAFGNAVLLKPAPEATACALRLAELIGPLFPPGVFQVLPGDVEAGRSVVDYADVVSFTGSTSAGGLVAAASVQRGVRVQAEMGGHNPAIVLPDADFEQAAAQIATAAMGFAGQKCTATKRVIVIGNMDAFRDAFVSAVEAQIVGDPAQAQTSVGPLIDEQARDRVVAVAADARRSGGRILTGGRPIPGDGWFVEPTIVEGVPAQHSLACDEVFGPICLLQSAQGLEEAIDLANGVPHGLAAGIYTRDLNAALDATTRLEAGLVKVNAPTSGVDFYLPFGGEKASSFGGREQGKAAHEFYTSLHTVTVGLA